MTHYYDLGGPEGMEIKRVSRRAKDEERELKAVAKMPKSVKETLETIAVNEHEHSDQCVNCRKYGIKWAEHNPVVRYRDVPGPERIVYRTQWISFAIYAFFLVLLGIYWFFHPLIKTVEVPSQSAIEQIRQMQDEAHIATLQKRLAYKFIQDRQYQKAMDELSK